MRVGVVKEIKDQERRVGLTPAGVQQLLADGHTIVVETGAGSEAGYDDQSYRLAGATIGTAEEAWGSDLVLKVKEPLASEFRYFDGQILFTFLHLAGVPAALTKALIKGRVTAIAYECVTDENGRYPLLAPMSAIAGNMAASIGAYYLAQTAGGKGIQPGKILDRHHGKVLVIGDGVVGLHAARSACGLGASVFLFGRERGRHEALLSSCPGSLQFVESSDAAVSEHIREADLVIGAVLRPGDRSPHVVSEAMVESMEAGSVLVDVSIDQGGCIETSQPTTHSNPVYRCHDVIHYAVTNMPGAYPRTATQALTEATLPYARRLAGSRLDALQTDPLFAAGVNTHRGLITNKPVAHALKLDSLYQPLTELL